MKTSLLTLLTALVPLITTLAQVPDTSPLLRLGRNGTQLEVTVPAEPTAGVLLLLQAADLSGLASAPALAVLTNAPVGTDLLLPLAPAQRAFYYAIRKAGRSLTDFLVPAIPNEPASPYALWTLGLPSPLVSGVTYTADFLIVVSPTALAAVNGPGQLSVRRVADGQLHPDAVVAPTQITFVQGACRASVRVTASTSLVGYVVAVSVPNVAPASPAPASPAPVAARVPANGKIPAVDPPLVLVPVIRLDGAPVPASEAFAFALEGVRALVDTPEWSAPVMVDEFGSPPGVAGNFGAWQGHVQDGQPNTAVHAGLDLIVAATTNVTAARGGIVRRVGIALGRYVTLDHLDGTYTRYLHLSPAVAAPVVGSYVDRGASIGQVGSTAETGLAATHLHFEIRRGPPGLPDGQPGIGLDPLRQAGMFGVRFPSAPSTLYTVGVTPLSPASQAYGRPTQPPVVAAADTAYVVVRVKHTERGRLLAPRAVRFRPEGSPAFVELSTPDTAAISNLLPASAPADGGFARYLHGNFSAPDVDEWFRYWFRWSVGGYAAAATGPRTFTVGHENFTGFGQSVTLKWGPEIIAVTPVGAPSSGVQRYQVQVRAWLGEAEGTLASDLAEGEWTTGADWYRYELPTGGLWVTGSAATYNEQAPAFGLAKLRTQDFLWTPPAGGSAGALVTVRSRTVPSIAHQLPFASSPCPLAGTVTPGPNMMLIPAGEFSMGDALDGEAGEQPVHPVTVSAFYIDQYPVTKALWDTVYAWAVTHGYSFDNPGVGKAANHPVQMVAWYDSVKWCNARSEMEGRVPAYYTNASQLVPYRSGALTLENTFVKWCAGYRLPTEAEWEKAARGGLSGKRFPWGDTISHADANYFSPGTFQGGPPYDLNNTFGYHPFFASGGLPYTSPVTHFAANAYGLFDLAGNVANWCWDRHGSYSAGSQSDPVGPATGVNRVYRGGSWGNDARVSRTAHRYYHFPSIRGDQIGFRSVLSPGQP